MKKENIVVDFNYITRNYDVLVADTCAIDWYLKGENRGSMKERREFATLLKRTIDRGHICIMPSAIIKELKDFKSTDRRETGRRQELIETYESTTRKGNLRLDEQAINAEIERNFQKYHSFGVSRADLSVLEHAKSFSEIGVPTAIISNDIRGISRAWSAYRKEHGVSTSELGFFPRRGFCTFQKFY